MPTSGSQRDGFLRCQKPWLTHASQGYIPICKLELVETRDRLGWFPVFPISRMTFLGGGRSCMYVIQPGLVELKKSNTIITDSGFKFSQLEMSKSPLQSKNSR